MSDIDKIPANQYILIEGVYSVKKKKKKDSSYSESQLAINYDRIIPIFTNLDNWPMRTNIKCWFCDLNFKTKPIPIGDRIFTDEGIDKIGVEGIACSFTCAFSYIIDTFAKNSTERFDRLEILKTLYTKITTRDYYHFYKSLPRTVRVEYGKNNMSIQDYMEDIARKEDLICVDVNKKQTL